MEVLQHRKRLSGNKPQITPALLGETCASGDKRRAPQQG